MFTIRVLATLGLALALVGTAPAKSEQPWVEASKVLTAVEADVQSQGLAGIKPHASEAEAALAGAEEARALAAKQGIALTDGNTDTLTQMLIAGSKEGAPTVAVTDPYRPLSFYLGSYYNETAQPDDALRVIAIGIAGERPGSGPGEYGEHLPFLLIEQGYAYGKLTQLTEALASYDRGLALERVPDQPRAAMFRGRGYMLIELNRLDEAEQAYLESLKIEPDNETAKGELEYIRGLREKAGK